MQELRRCRDGGYVVGRDAWLPEDPRERYDAGYGIYAVGCNRLMCAFCRQPTRQQLGFGRPPAGHDAGTLYETPSWSELDPAAGGTGRLYVCACYAAVVHAPGSSVLDPDDVDLTTQRWSCAGHPPLEVPGSLAGLDLGTPFDAEALVDSWLTAAGRPPAHPHLDQQPGFVLTRIYSAFASDDLRRALSLAVAKRGRSPQPEERAAAVLFFSQYPQADGFDDLLRAWTAHPERYDGLPLGFGPERDGRGALVRALALRLLASARDGRAEPPALEALRWAARGAPGLRGAYGWLTMIDPTWANEHLPALISADPENWDGALDVLPADGLGGLEGLVAAAEAALGVGADPEELLEVLAERQPWEMLEDLRRELGLPDA